MQVCPKCNFKQPPDEFCASCGINMSKYVPAPKKFSLWDLATHWLFQFIVVLLVIFALVIYDGESGDTTNSQATVNREQVETQITDFSEADENHSDASEEEERSYEKDPPQDQIATRAKKAQAANKTRANGFDRNSTSPVSAQNPLRPKGSQKSAEQNTQPQDIQRIEYRFYKTPLKVLQKHIPTMVEELSNESSLIVRAISKSSDFNSLTRDSETRLITSRTYRGLKRGEKRRFSMLDNSGEAFNPGLVLDMEFLSVTPSSLDVEVDSWIQVRPELGEISLYRGSFVLNKAQSALFINVLPKSNRFSPEDLELMEQDQVLSIMSSPEYIEDDMMVVLLIEID